MEMASYADRTCASRHVENLPAEGGTEGCTDFMDFWDDSMTRYGLT